jgi:hypothetical protein
LIEDSTIDIADRTCRNDELRKVKRIRLLMKTGESISFVFLVEAKRLVRSVLIHLSPQLSEKKRIEKCRAGLLRSASGHVDK